MEAFANALRTLPSIIAENGGYDSAQLVSELRALHATGNHTAGLNMYEVGMEQTKGHIKGKLKIISSIYEVHMLH